MLVLHKCQPWSALDFKDVGNKMTIIITKKIYNTQPYKSLYKLTLEMEPKYLTKSDIQLNPYLENKIW